MRSHRLSRLAVLTQGVALVGFGLAELACSKEPNVNGPVKEGPHINAPPEKPAPSSSAPPPEAPHVNAPIAQGTSAPSASAATSASAAPATSAKPAKK